MSVLRDAISAAIELSLREEAFTTEDDACRIADVVLAVLDEHTTDEFALQQSWGAGGWLLLDSRFDSETAARNEATRRMSSDQVVSRRVSAWTPVATEGENE